MNINNDENETMVGMEKNGAKLQKQFGPQNLFGCIFSHGILLDIIGCERKYIKDYEHISSAFKIRMK